ncbi:tripartite tricarboxylate transporter substrate binding protein [Variovorax sp. J22R24]|uniref:Bug family tripartite tricarboxylate transporter substrate binding protein n=1 Tax=Variovorax gracilis TaxID=3053502 RepID=UPI002575E706|nr:tripartite tricarboxylate transporter substrate binding protein [Variovorax sp. J22R24]MDM0110276.1 tripartite tricarboxylate transporter substrate binding protein [Variovorax sp. J22R24]
MNTLKGLMAVAGAALAFAGSAQAENFPAKPIKIITPFPAGQGPDVLLRILADKMSKTLGQAVIVDNRPGASGFIAFDVVKRAAPDGYTLGQIDSFQVGTQPHLFAKLPYNVLKDFEPVTPLIRNSFFVTVAAGSKWKSMSDVIAAAKAKPGAVSYGSWNVASPAHLGGLLLESTTGTKMTHIPFKETSQLYQSVANGEVDWAIGSAASAGSLQQAGKLRFIAVAAPKRMTGYTDVPTAKEAGAPAHWEVSGWNGLLAPKGTPQDIVLKINEAVTQALKEPDVQAKLATFTYEPYAMKPSDMTKLMEAEIAKWGPTIRDAGIKLD